MSHGIVYFPEKVEVCESVSCLRATFIVTGSPFLRLPIPLEITDSASVRDAINWSGPSLHRPEQPGNAPSFFSGMAHVKSDWLVDSWSAKWTAEGCDCCCCPVRWAIWARGDFIEHVRALPAAVWSEIRLCFSKGHSLQDFGWCLVPALQWSFHRHKEISLLNFWGVFFSVFQIVSSSRLRTKLPQAQRAFSAVVLILHPFIPTWPHWVIIILFLIGLLFGNGVHNLKGSRKRFRIQKEIFWDLYLKHDEKIKRRTGVVHVAISV